MIPVTRTGNAAHDMAAIMAKVRKMSDSQLADILSGKDVSVPQFAAMTEAMGRKQLRQAVDGAQAQQQAQQPSIKDQLLSEQAGLAALPAPNMESMDMASGGIVAFDEGGRVPTWEDVQKSLERYQGAQTPWYLPTPKVNPADAYAQEYQDLLNAYQNKRVVPGLLDGEVKSAKKEEPAPAAPAAPAPSTKADKEAPAAPSAAPAAAAEPSSRAKFERRANPFEGMQAKATDAEKIKSQGLGEGLMKLSRALLTTPGMKGVGEGIGALGEQGALTRKEIAGLEKDARDYNFNIAKAREAADQGNDELALKYETLAEQAKYRTGLLGIQQQKLGMMKDQYDMVKIPAQLSNIYAKATDAVKAATAMRPVKPAEFQKMVDEEYRKRATAVGLGKAIDMYSPSAPAYNMVQSPKGAKSNIYDPYADEG